MENEVSSVKGSGALKTEGRGGGGEFFGARVQLRRGGLS